MSSNPPVRPRWLRGVNGQRAFGVLLIILSVASVVLVGLQAKRLNEVTRCQAAYNLAFAESLEIRTEAAKQERQSQRELLTTLLSNPGNRSMGRAALDKYIAVLNQADQERQASPLPNNDCRDQGLL